MENGHSNHQRLRLIGRISIWFSVVALAALIELYLLFGKPTDSYLDYIQSLSLSQSDLPMIMSLGGLLLLVGTGITIWLIVLYSSFLVIGPLYRFARNLDAGIRDGTVTTTPIRTGDDLQPESQLLIDSVSSLYQHYQQMENTVNTALQALDAEDNTQLDSAIQQLQEQQAQFTIEADRHGS